MKNVLRKLKLGGYNNEQTRCRCEKHPKKIYGKRGEIQSHALKGVSSNIREGEFIGIMGPSGSGKTTLLNVISTLDNATGGSIEIAGVDITKMKPRELSDFRSQKLGFIFQDFNLLGLTIHAHQLKNGNKRIFVHLN